MVGDTTRLKFELFGRDNASPVFDKFGRKVRDTGKDIHFLSSATKGLLAGFASYASISAATNFLREANDEARESQKVNALTANALATTGAVAWQTADGVSALATAISNKAAVDDEAVQTGANLLLTFKRVRNEAGAGADIFDRATAAAVDLSAAGFGSIDSAAKMLGKALNDPLKGITALNRAGVNFTQQQKDQIKSLVEHNDLLGAQKIILKEVESQVKGSAEAQATAGDRMTVAWKNAEEEIGTALLPVVDDLADALADKAGPAAENFADFLTDDGIPALHAFYDGAKPVAEDVLPAIADAAGVALDVLQLLAPIVGDVAEGFSGLGSGGQQAILLGAGVAMLSRKMGGFNVESNGMLMNLRTMPDEMRKSTIKAAALRVGVGAAGLGLSAFSDEIGESNEVLGHVAGALGAAATGFAVAGPWGAAVAGGVTILQAFGGANRDAAAMAQELGRTLDTQSGKITKNTAAFVTNTLQKQGAFKAAQKLGIDNGTLTDAALGNKAAQAAVAAAMNRVPKPTTTGGRGVSGTTNTTEEMRAVTKLKNSLGPLTAARQKEQAAIREQSAAQRSSIEANRLDAATIKEVARATKGIPDKVITQFTQPGYEGAVHNAVNIAKKYRLTPTQVITALSALDYSTPKIAKVLAGMGLARKDVVTALKATDLSSAKIKKILDELAKLKDKNIKINTTYSYSGNPSGATGRTRSADGNIFEAFAQGGTHENHVAQIGNGLVTREWNEPETMGEAYIPFAPSKIVRSREIAKVAVSKLGGTATFADGGIHAASDRRAAGAAATAGAVDPIDYDRLAAAMSRMQVQVKLGVDERTATKLVLLGSKGRFTR